MRIAATVYQGKEAQYLDIDKYPDACPLCHHALEPKHQDLAHVTMDAGRRLEIVFQCPRERCQSFFIARYYARYGSHWLSGCFPLEPADEKFSKHISTISPDFCAIANQAHKAEGQGWHLVAGPGYRKALEFLIKDYLCRLRPGDADKIKRAQLGICIESYVDNEKVKSTAARAAWLGNDETHYLRKWKDKDLEGLKKLIRLTLHWIEMEEETNTAVRDIPESKKA